MIRANRLQANTLEDGPRSPRRERRSPTFAAVPPLEGRTREGRLCRAAALGIEWAEEKEAWLEGTPPWAWPEEWSPAWAGDTHGLTALAVGQAETVELFDLAHAAAAERWSEIVDDRRARANLQSHST